MASGIAAVALFVTETAGAIGAAASFGTVAASSAVAQAIGGALVGAAAGAVTSAVKGDDVLKGTIKGALVGVGVTGVASLAGSAATSMLSGSAPSLIPTSTDAILGIEGGPLAASEVMSRTPDAFNYITGMGESSATGAAQSAITSDVTRGLLQGPAETVADKGLTFGQQAFITGAAQGAEMATTPGAGEVAEANVRAQEDAAIRAEERTAAEKAKIRERMSKLETQRPQFSFTDTGGPKVAAPKVAVPKNKVNVKQVFSTELEKLQNMIKATSQRSRPSGILSGGI